MRDLDFAFVAFTPSNAICKLSIIAMRSTGPFFSWDLDSHAEFLRPLIH